MGRFVKELIIVFIGLTNFGVCSVYTVIVAKNFEQIIQFHSAVNWDIRIYIAILLIPITLICWIPTLKHLSKLAMLSNLIVLVGLIITVYYCLVDTPPLSQRPLHTSVLEFPMFFGIAIFSLEPIVLILPMENQMKNPRELFGIFGVLNLGMIIVTVLYSLVGFVGFAKYGDDIRGSITLNLPTEEAAAQTVKILIGSAVFFTTALQFYVLQEVVWNKFEGRITKHRTLANYMLRTVLMTAAVLLAIAVPTIGPFVALIGALCLSFLGLLVPAVIDILTRWEDGFGKFNWIAWKNGVICIFGIMALIVGSQNAIKDILKLYELSE